MDVQDSCIDVMKVRRPRSGLSTSSSSSSTPSPESGSTPEVERTTSSDENASGPGPTRNGSSFVDFTRPDCWSNKDLQSTVKLTTAQFVELCDLLEPYECSSERMGLSHRARVFLFLNRELKIE